MNKTLTEKWRNEELPINLYYVIDNIGRETIGTDCGIRDMMVDALNGGNIFIKEVLAPVPSYDECQTLENNCEILHAFWKGAKEKINKLEEQLNEANKVIESLRTYDFTVNDENAESYQVKYGIAGEKIYTNKKPPKEFEYWRKKIKKSSEKKLKSGV